MKRKNRIVTLTALLVLILVLAGCADSEKDWQEQYDLGMRCLEEGDYEEAILAFAAAIKIDPDRPEAYMGRAEAYKAVDEPEKALKDYKKAQRAAKKDDDEYEDLLEELEELIEKLEEWIDEHDDDDDRTGEDDNDWVLEDDWHEDDTDHTDVPESTFQITVTDAYTDYVVDYYGVECCYHIPRINLKDDRAAEVNSEIYDLLMGLLEDNVQYSYPNGGTYVRYGKILYSWGIKDDILSVLVMIRHADYEWVDFIPYNISIKTGEKVTDDVLLAAYGLNESSFRAQARTLLAGEVDDYSPELIEAIGQDFYDYIVTSTLSEENLELAMPYVGGNGNLCMAACVYGAAGAGYYWHTFDLEQQVNLPGTQCTADHGAGNTAEGYSLEEITAMVAQWYNNNLGGYENGTFSASDQETYISGSICGVVIRFQNTDPEYTGGANTLVAVVEVDMTTGDMWADGEYLGKLW